MRIDTEQGDLSGEGEREAVNMNDDKNLSQSTYPVLK